MSCDYKYFKAETIDGSVKTSGQQSCFIGYSYPAADYPRDGGVWAKWEYDRGCLTIENDCLGFCPLYYYVDDRQITVSDSILKIISIVGDVELDTDAISILCWKNYLLQDKTVYKNIYTLAPGTTIKWSGGKFEKTSSLLPVKHQSLTQQQIVDGYIDLFKQAIERNLPTGDFIIPLSGGRDSRWILLELLERGYKPKVCVSCGEIRDVEIATELAGRLGLEHCVIDRRANWVKDEVRKNAKISFSTLQHNWLMVLADFVRADGRLSYDGNGIGMFSRNGYLDEGMRYFDLFEADKFEQLEDEIFPDESYKVFDRLPAEFDFLKDRNVDNLKQIHYNELKKYKGYVNSLSAYSFYSNTRTAISTCPFDLMRPAEIKFPYLDYDLFSFIASIEPAKFIAAEPQALAIKKAFPALADIPFYDELEFKPAPRAGKITKITNCFELLKYLRLFGQPALKSLIDVKVIDRLNNSDYSLFTNILLTLAMIKYCSKSVNAASVLGLVEKMELCER